MKHILHTEPEDPKEDHNGREDARLLRSALDSAAHYVGIASSIGLRSRLLPRDVITMLYRMEDGLKKLEAVKRPEPRG